MTDDAGGWADRLKSGLLRVFPERQVIIRTDARTRYLRLTTGLQLGVLGGWLVVAGWIGFTTVGYYTQGSMISVKNEAIDRSRLAYRKLLDQVSDRSEEHTSELQSLMRISYAVFCLKKK